MTDITEPKNESLDCSQEERRQYALQCEINDSKERATLELNRGKAMEKLNELQQGMQHTVAEVGTQNHFHHVLNNPQLHQEQALNGIMLGGILCAHAVKDISHQYHEAQVQRIEQALAVPNDPVYEQQNQVLQDALAEDLKRKQEYSMQQQAENQLAHETAASHNEMAMSQEVTQGIESD